MIYYSIDLNSPGHKAHDDQDLVDFDIAVKRLQYWRSFGYKAVLRRHTVVVVFI